MSNGGGGLPGLGLEARGNTGAIYQFRSAIQSAGLNPPDEIQPDGKLHRFASNGKRSDDAGWYVFHNDGIPAGAFGCWRGDVSETWRADIGRRLSVQEEYDHRTRVEAIRREREAEDAARWAEAREKAAAIWQTSRPAPADHAYLFGKGVKSHGLRIHDGALVIPMRDGAELHSLQFISSDGGKRFLTGGRVSGGYFSIGKPNGKLCIAEGYATGASIHEATGCAVAVAFNAGNLLPVARALRAKYPELRLIICADDDTKTRGNPGLTKAREAALEVGALLAVPDFGTEKPEGASDFNDMSALHGLEAVGLAVASASAPVGNSVSLDEWPQPQPLPGALPPVKPFDLDLLPAALRPWIQDISDRVQCPPDFPAVGAMISLAAVVGRKIGIRPKRQDDWLEVPNLWGAIIGRPGVMKSPALREAMRPLRKLEAEAFKDFEGKRQEWDQKNELHKLKREADRAKIVKAYKDGGPVEAKALGGGVTEDEPHLRRYVVNDCSVEALGEILRYNSNGTLAYRDELIGLLKSLDKEGNEGARGFFLSGWSGTDSYTFDRIGRGLNLRIEACCLSLLGSIQPAIIGAYLRQAVAGGGHDGLLSRFQLLVWPDVSGSWKDVDRWPDTEAKTTANDTFDRLDKLIPKAEQDGGIPFLRFDADAQGLFAEWRATFEQRIRSGDDHPAFESHLAKYRKLVPAMSLLIHLADKGGDNVGETALLKALSWAEYLESHSRRAYASVTQAEAESARALITRIRRGEVTSPFAARDIYLKHWACLSNPEEVREAVRLLCDLDWLREEQQQTLGRPKTQYWINPNVKQA